MKLIKIICFLFLLSSCDKYLGNVEADYIPKNESSKIFLDEVYVNSLTELALLNPILYPKKLSKINQIKFSKVKKILSLDEDTVINFNNRSLFYTKENFLYKIDLDNIKIRSKYSLILDKDEKVINIFNYIDQILVLTNKSKLYLFKDDSITLKSDNGIYIKSEFIKIENKIILFSVFGEVLEVDLDNNDTVSKGNFIINHGLSINSDNYGYLNLISHLFNSGTLVFINKINNEIESNYYLEDLNLLSDIGNYNNLIVSPFEYGGYLYFLDKKGLIGVFDPLSSEIFWEININSSIKDFIFTTDGKLIILSKTEVIIFDVDNFHSMRISHELKHPKKILIDKEKLFIIEKKGIYTYLIQTGEQFNFIKNKFDGNPEIMIFDSDIYVKDSKKLFKLSE